MNLKEMKIRFGRYHGKKNVENGRVKGGRPHDGSRGQRSHFGSRPFLAQGSRCSRAVCRLLWWCLFALVRFCHVYFSDTVHYAQRMDEGTRVGWLGTNRLGPPPEVGALATCESSEAQCQSTNSSVRRSCSPNQTAQSSAGDCREGSERRGAQVGGRSRCTWRREQ